MFEIIAIAVVIAVAVAYIASPKVRQLFRIRGSAAVRSGTSAVERVEDRVKQAVAKLPAQRELVAKQMSAADRAQTAAKNKATEAETLFKQVQTATTANATPGTIGTLKTKWLAAKTAVTNLNQAAIDAHKSADEAQGILDDLIATIQTSSDGVEQLKSDANLASIYRESATFKQQIADMKSGLGDVAKDTAAVQDELNTAKHLNELAGGSAAEREMAQIQKQSAVSDADAAFAAELAARNPAAK